MKKAPDFALPNQHNQIKTLADYAGKWLVLYFYPKDNTPACTKEACAFADGRSLLQSLGAEVVGISADSVRSHHKFATKHNLDFTLLSDPDHTVIKAYGSWGPKVLFGREYLGIHRDTYLISPKGEIVKKFAGVNPKLHFQEVLQELRHLQI